MAKMIRHDYGVIHDALNKMIVAEVKAALELLPEKKMETEDRVPLCRIVVSSNGEYCPRDMSVSKVWVDESDVLHIKGESYPRFLFGTEEFVENDDLLDITDFGYLIDQIAEKVEGDKTYNLPNKSLMTAGYVTELSLKQAVEKLVTV